jgi:hypothetical protein
MSTPKNPSSSPNEDDPWEQLADQFGLDSGKEYASREPAPPAESGSLPVEESEAQSSRSRREVPLESEVPVDEPPRFASEAVEPPETEFGEADSRGPDSEGVTDEATASSDGGLEPAAATPTSPQDSYWDALANWNWNESEGGEKKSRSEPARPEPRRADEGRTGGGPPPRGGRRGREEGRGHRGGERPPRQPAGPPPTPAGSRPAPQPSRSPPPAAPLEGDDFGLGLDAPESSPREETPAAERQPAPMAHDDVSTSPAGTPPSKTESPAARTNFRGDERGGRRQGEHGPDGGGEGDFPRKRRRRRRRRRGGRGGEGAPGGQSAGATTPAGDWDDSAGPEADEIQPTIEATANERPGEFSADRHSEEVRARRRERRDDEQTGGGSSQQPPRDVDEEDEPEVVFQAGGESGDVDLDTESGDDSDELGEEQTVSYENVPTWEEAISFLLHPNQVQVESGGGGGSPPRSAPPADQPRQTRHIGHRKHRR